ncbi:folylpolyglutamate synthase/dihydrofolate synthase family protein [Ruminococcus sp. FC2018]|uniref:bifunctional folylpolyglutamate synthase/dihydrofolate synthase n=1 Tax=Ruminococcus sp. FC2018 TaxID=1410617 RepID=UPI00048A6388|nr:folylpolyglutamate synthase/dihydrofolate synthase family protein [Ruminococcus sp. FC2018]
MIENSTERSGIDFINSFSHSGKPVKDLGRISRLLDTLGRPQDSLKFVHVAGTNGKGSCCEMFNSVFMEAGLQTGCFTSPYILHYNDRIRLNGEDIDDRELSQLAARVKAAVDISPDKNDFSQFEISQAIAFLYFAKHKCDIVVLETGLGGLLDCTNVITTPVLTVITTIDLDHTAILGDTIAEIAAQKAGIIKPGVPCVLSVNNSPEAVKVVSQTAAEKNSLLIIPDTRRLTVKALDCFGSSFEYSGMNYKLSMGGEHQITNALSVIHGCGLLKDTLGLTDDNIRRGIGKAVLSARVEVLCKKPLTILDGAHNPDGLRALAKVLSDCKMKCHAIIGMCKDKNIDDAVAALISYVDEFYTVDGFSDRAIDKGELAARIAALGGEAQPCALPIDLQIKALQKVHPNDMTLICGSLYLASQVKTDIKKAEA